MPYVLPTKAIDPSLVGDSYHLALGLTSPGQPSPDRIFGYLLAEGTKFQQKTDLKTRDTLISSSSPHLIDRDLVATPRVSDGDFSGGALQINFIDPTRYWDSDLDIRNPGYLMLAPAWASRTLVVSPGVAGPFQMVAFRNNVYLCPGAGANIYRGSDGAAIAPGINPVLMDTDGNQLFVADGVNTVRSSAANSDTGWANVSVAIGAIKQMWAVNLGTGGRFLYYTTDFSSLKKVDLSTNTINIDVPLGGANLRVVDLCQYLAGVAVVTSDPGVSWFLGWFNYGQNQHHRVRGFQNKAAGLCQCLGQLFVTATSTGLFEPPVLMQVSAGSFQIIARIGLPFIQLTFSWIGDPVASGQYVAFPIGSPQVNGISSAFTYIGLYDVLEGSYSHFPVMNGNDYAGVGQGISTAPGLILRPLAFNGRAVTFGNQDGSNNTIFEYQMNGYSFTTAQIKYQPSGWLFSSRFDFNTPGIEKLFRRILIHHAPLRAGESILVNAYVDRDPTSLTTTSPVNPTGATITNNLVGSDTTVLILPAHTLGFCMVVGLQLFAGTLQATTPAVYYMSVEASVSWTWTFTIDCSSRRRLLNGGEDSQGLRGKDLIMLVQTAWENALPLTLYHPNGTVYTAVIEEAVLEMENPINRNDPEHMADLEGVWTLTLRDSIV